MFEDDKFVMTKSYFDESYFTMPVHDSEIILHKSKKIIRGYRNEGVYRLLSSVRQFFYEEYV